MKIDAIGSNTFNTFSISASGLGTYKLWLDAVADNVANVNTIRSTDEAAFQERYVMVESVEGGDFGVGRGVRVTGAAFGDPLGIVSYMPDHPLADADGMVRRPDIDLSTQMTYLIEAQRGYQANASVFERARAAYESLLTIGR